MARRQTITWKPVPLGEGWPPEDEDVVVWIDIQKLDQAWKKHKGYVGRNGVGSNMAGRYKEAGKWIPEFARTGRPAFMPSFGVDGDGAVSFSDGRHRVAWLRDHGATALPVAVPRGDAEILAKNFGTSERETIFFLDQPS